MTAKPNSGEPIEPEKKSIPSSDSAVPQAWDFFSAITSENVSARTRISGEFLKIHDLIDKGMLAGLEITTPSFDRKHDGQEFRILPEAQNFTKEMLDKILAGKDDKKIHSIEPFIKLHEPIIHIHKHEPHINKPYIHKNEKIECWFPINMKEVFDMSKQPKPKTYSSTAWTGRTAQDEAAFQARIDSVKSFVGKVMSFGRG